LVIFAPGADESHGSSFAGKYDEREALAQESAYDGAMFVGCGSAGLIADHCYERSVDARVKPAHDALRHFVSSA
jgi:hypothetical protein